MQKMKLILPAQFISRESLDCDRKKENIQVGKHGAEKKNVFSCNLRPRLVFTLSAVNFIPLWIDITPTTLVRQWRMAWDQHTSPIFDVLCTTRTKL